MMLGKACGLKATEALQGARNQLVAVELASRGKRHDLFPEQGTKLAIGRFIRSESRHAQLQPRGVEGLLHEVELFGVESLLIGSAVVASQAGHLGSHCCHLERRRRLRRGEGGTVGDAASNLNRFRSMSLPRFCDGIRCRRRSGESIPEQRRTALGAAKEEKQRKGWHGKAR